jgi:hypothetical protein
VPQVGTYLPMKMKQSVPKRLHKKFRRRGITQKKEYNYSYYSPLFRLIFRPTNIL